MIAPPDQQRLVAEATEGALRQAAAECPVLQIAAELRRRANEWGRAARDCGAAGEEEATIELLCAVTPGMQVFEPGMGFGEDSGWLPVVRNMQSGGQWSLHVELPDRGTPRYINYSGPTSPVVVQGGVA